MTFSAPVWCEVDLKAIAHNIRELKRITNPSAEFMAVVKANAYGHGAYQVARVALENGATRLAVARVKEGVALRLAGIDAPILILGYTVLDDYRTLLDYDLTQTVYSLLMAEQLSSLAAQLGKKAKVHIKVDTGMGRLGVCTYGTGPNYEKAVNEITSIVSLSHLEVEGIYTHFATADSRDKTHAMQQWYSFNDLLTALAKNGLTFQYRHAANSAALIDLPETHLDLVRAGIAIYGIPPSHEVMAERVSLKPAMCVKARVAHVKRVPAGTGISYGITYVVPADTEVATIPAGYADGYNRLLSSRGQVLLRGQRVPVIGRVCMDQFMVDVGGVPGVEPGEEVVLMGRQDKEEVSAWEIAEKIGTIAYEVLCMVSARVPRYYIH